jgi:tetratricopeptide (TPR) repeat protein
MTGLLTLLLTLSFSRGQRKRFPILRRLDGKQLSLGFAAALSLLLGFGLSAYRDGLIARRSFSLQLGPATLQETVATLDAFELELLEASTRAANDARRHFQEATGYFNEGDYHEAIPEYRASLAALPTLSAFLNLGISLRWSFQPAEAEQVLKAGLEKARAVKRRRFEAHFLFQLGSVQHRLTRSDAGEEALLSALVLYRELGDDLGIANASLNLSEVYRVRRKDSAYHEFAEDALGLYREVGNELGVANVLQNRALGEVFSGKIEGALQSFRESYSQYRELGNKFGELAAQYSIGTCLLFLGRYQEAEAELESALALARALEDLSSVVMIQGQLVFLYLEEEDFATALDVARQVQAIVQEHQLPAEPLALVMIGQCLLDMGNPDGALEKAEEAFHAAEAGQNPVLMADALLLEGMAMLRLGRAREAIALLRTSADQNSAMGNSISVASALKGLGEALLAIGESEEGLATLKKADAMFKRTGLRVKDAERLRDLIREEEERQGQQLGSQHPSGEVP